MNKEEINKLGFLDEEEMLLYQDVCCDDLSILQPKSFQEFIDSIDDDNVNQNFSKEDYEKYIKSNGLLDLFNKVKGMSIFNRLIEIYVYYANNFLICKDLEKLINKKLEESKELFDGEKEQKYNNKIWKIRHMRTRNFRRMLYIKKQVRNRFPAEETNFSLIVKDIDNNVLIASKDGNNRGKK